MVLALVAAFSVATAPAAAKKKASKPGSVKTATATVNTTTDGQVASAIATCPGKTKVIGGGFVLGIKDEAYPNGPDQNNALESRRDGDKSWRVTALRDDRQASGGGPAGNPLPITAEAYCRTRPGKITEVATTQTFTGPGGPANFSPASACPFGRAAIGGGFALTQADFVSYNNFLTTNAPLGDVAWRLASLASASGSPSATSYVYCQKMKKPLRQTSASAGMPVPSNGSALAAVDTPACPGKRTAVAGGWEAPNYTAGQGVTLPVESRRAGKSWHASTANLFSGPAGGRFTVFALCG